MFSKIDNFNFSVFNGQSILSGRSTANTKGSLGFPSGYLYVICHSLTLVLSCVFITKCSVINKLRALSRAIM